MVYSSDKFVKFFNQALYVDALRGKHGTGVFSVDGKGDVATYKKALCSADFLELETTKKIAGNGNAVFMVGHNRFATQGAHTSENSHPFNHSHIHMVHNGTLDFYRTLTPGKSFTVDSDAIAYLLSEAQSPLEVLEKIEGAFSLVWYDELERTLNFARNKERPMFISTVKGSSSLLFASESGMIEWLADRLSIDVEDTVPLGVGKWLSVPLDLSKNKSILTKFKPKEGVEYYVNSYPRQSNVTSIISKKKYSYLEGLEGVDVVLDSWTPYNPQSVAAVSYGKLEGTYNKDLTIVVPSIQRSEYADFLGKSVRVKIRNVVSDTLANGSILGLSEFFKIQEEKDRKKEELRKALEKEDEENEKLKGVIEYEDLQNLPVLFRGSEHPTPIEIESLQDKVKHGCTNCGDVLLADDVDDVMWDTQGNPYCPDCTLAYVQTH